MGEPMTDCHHRTCCGCGRPARVVAAMVGDDGATRLNLCRPHYLLLILEAKRKGVLVTVDDE